MLENPAPAVVRKRTNKSEAGFGFWIDMYVKIFDFLLQGTNTAL